MKIGIMQPYFFPYIGYFQLIKSVDTFVVFDDVNYIKKGWINRNSLLVNGNAYLFRMALLSVSQNKYINEIEIDENSSWKQDLLKTISMSYKKAPFFEQVFPLVERIILVEENNLSKFLTHHLKQVCEYLKIETKIIISSNILKNDDVKGQDKIIEICKSIKGNHYINPIGGTELYNKDVFLNENLKLNFIKTNTIAYKQFKNDFIPWLSIIDVMMFNSIEEISLFLDNYELV